MSDKNEDVGTEQVHSAPKNPWKKWLERNTRTSAVRAFCYRCCGGEPENQNGARGLIRECPSGPDSVNPCPLHNWRPYK